MKASTVAEEETIALTLPVAVLRQATQLAKQTNREVEQVLRSVVTHAFPALYTHPQRFAMQQEEASFNRIQSRLIEEYPDEFVAMLDGQVVDHDTEPERLLERINNLYPTEVVLIRQVTDDLDKVSRVRSPRLLRGSNP